MRGLAFAYAPIFVFVSLAANQTIALLFPKYLASVPIFRVNLLIVLLQIVAVDPIVRAFQSQRFWLLGANIAFLGGLAVGLFLGIPRFGLIGAVSCVIGVQYLLRTLMVWRIWHLLNVRWADLRPLRDIFKTLLAAGVAGLCIFPLLIPVQRWGALASLLVCGVIFCAVYLLALLLLRVPSKSEIQFARTWMANFVNTRLKAAGTS
jgi:hypothetical protein